MLKSDADLEQRVIDLINDATAKNLDTLETKCLVALDIMTVLRSKTNKIVLRDVSDLKLNEENGQDVVIFNSDCFVLLFDDEMKSIAIEADFLYKQGLVLIPFKHKHVYYHALIIACELESIPYGEVVPGMCNSWE